MGASTFSLSKKNKARQARRAGKIDEAEALEKAAKKFVPKTADRTEAKVEAKVEAKTEVKKEVDLDGDGKADVVIAKK